MTALTKTAAQIRPLVGAVPRPYVAGEALNVGDAVCLDGSNTDKVLQADANVSAARARGIGIVVASYDGETAIASGHACTVVVFGPVGGFSSLTPGAYGYVSNTAGEIDDAAGTFAFILGYAERSNVFFVQPGIDDPNSP